MREKCWMWMVVVAAVVSLVAAGCGDDDTDVGESDELPVNTAGTDDVVIAEPPCAPGEPECDDTVDVPDEGQDLPADDEGATSTGAVTIDGGLSVSDALATDATGTLAVRGHGFFDEDGDRICESLAPGGERYECGGASVVVENLDLESTGATVVYHDGLAYTDEEITVLGELVDGVFVIDDMVAG